MPKITGVHGTRGWQPKKITLAKNLIRLWRDHDITDNGRAIAEIASGTLIGVALLQYGINST